MSLLDEARFASGRYETLRCVNPSAPTPPDSLPPPRSRSPITRPGYRKGVPPANKGTTLPPEVLTPDEVGALFDAIKGDGPLSVRNRAMVALMYRAEIKVGALVRIAVHNYESNAGVLTVPGSNGQSSREIRLDLTSKRLISAWMTARAGLRLRGTAPLFCAITENRGGPLRTQNIRMMLDPLRERAGIQKRVKPEGLRASRANHRENEAGRFEATLAEYVNGVGFRGRYPVAYQKWVDAHQMLEAAPDRLAPSIGHLCREAIIEFSDQLAREYEVGPFGANKTKAKVRAIFEAHGDISRTVRRSLEALLDYWETVVDLTNRQEHGRNLTADDSRAVAFQTMLVMREVDLALGAGA
jgi:hypothetical protein